MDNKEYPDTVDKIKDYVVRPTEELIDTTNSGSGKYSISPLAFPNVNVSGDSNPTRLTPAFIVSYKDPKIYTGQNNYEENSEIGIIRKNFAFGSSSNTINLDPSASDLDDFYNYFTIRIIDGTGKGQKRNIIDYVGSTREATVDVNWTIVPDTSSIFLILVRQETAQGGSLNTITLDSNASTVNGFYDSIIVTNGDEIQIIRRLIRIISGTGSGQVRFSVTTPPGVTYDGTTKVLTVSEDWDIVPDNTSEFIILQTHPYKWDGTENDNKFGTYLDEYNDPIIDSNTNEPINHLRKDFSSEEVVDFLRDKLASSISMGRYNGMLSKWLFGGASNSVNIGGAGSKEVFIDSFSINKNARVYRTFGNTNPEDEVLVSAKRKKLKKHKRYTRWLLSNTNYDNLSSTSKSPFVKNYPYTYNSENPIIEGTSQGGSSVDIILENSQNTKTVNDYYINSIIEIISGTGSGQKAKITAYDGGTLTATIDLIEVSGEAIEDINPNTSWDIIPDNTSIYKLYVIKEAGHLDVSVDSDNYRVQLNASVTPNLRPFTDDMLYYMKDNAYHNNITLDMANDGMYGRHHISLLHKLYMADTGTNQTIISGLDSMYSSGVPSPATDPHIIRRIPDTGSLPIDDNEDFTIDRNVTKYLYKKRNKYTITNLVASPTVPTSTELQYTDGVNQVTIHLIPNTNDLDFILSHPSKSASDIRTDILENNNIVPDIIYPSDVNDMLDVLFVDNDSTNPSDSFFEQEKQRSKKTFIHLPTKNIEDGTVLELDVSLPKEPDSQSFVENTLGVLSGYKNYISQPRVYIFSGYQAKVGNVCNFDVGLTEVNNPYLFSPIPEVEYSVSGNDSYESNIFHQRKMDISDINGNKYIRIITFPSSYTQTLDSDIGKYVTGNTSTNKGVLLNSDNTNKIWAVRLLDTSADFDTSEVFTIDNGTGTGTGVVSEPISDDKRALLAVVYPSTTSTFGWRLDKDPQFKLMHWSILANSEYLGSASYRSFERNRIEMLDYSDIFSIGLSVFPISYKNGLFGYSNYSMYLSGCVRTYLQDNLNPTASYQLVSNENLQYSSVIKQASKAHTELIRDFEKSRVRYNLRFDTSDFSSFGLRVTFNNSAISSVPSGYFDGFEVFNNFETPGNQNFSRWMSKPKDIPEYILKATDSPIPLEYETIEGYKDPFAYSVFLKNYISAYSITDKPRNSDAGTIYIPGTLYPNTNPSYEYGQGTSNILTNYLIDTGVDIRVVNDFRRRLWDSSHQIDFYSYSHPGFRRKFDFYEFDSEDVNDESYFREFNGMLNDPFSRIFSLNSVNPEENSIDLISDLAMIQSIGYESSESTLINAIKSNPVLEKYYKLSNSIVPQEVSMSRMVGIHDYFSDLSDDTNHFLRNYVTYYANNLTTRFYNSFRIALTGDESSTAHDSNNGSVENYDTDRTYNSSVHQYFNNIVSSADRAKSIDDDYVFFYSSGDIIAEDMNPTWTFFDKGHGFRGLNTATYAQGAALNEITLDLLASSDSDFYTGNLITITSGTGSGQTKTITAYDGNTKVATVDSPWTTIPDNSSTFEIKTHLKNLITTNGQQFRFKKGFYDSKGDTAYIKVKMKFIFSKKVGRWLTLDYRQYPMTYLTPTFGNEALSYKEKSITFAGKSGNSISDYVPILGIDTNTNFLVTVSPDKRSLQFTGANGGWETTFPDGSDIFIFKLSGNAFDYNNYTIDTIKYVTVTHEAIAPSWNNSTTYTNGNYVEYEGIVYLIQNGPISGGYAPKYNPTNFSYQEPKPVYAPLWNANTSINSGTYITYNQSVYLVSENVNPNEATPNINSKYQLIDSFGVVSVPWTSGSYYYVGSKVEYSGIIYEALNTVSLSLISPDSDSNFAIYIKPNKYAVEWNFQDTYQINTYVRYDEIFYRTLQTVTGGNNPSIHPAFIKISYMTKTPGTDQYVFNWLMTNIIPANITSNVYMSLTKNTIDETTYPLNLSNGETITDYLWKQECSPSFDTPYYKMTPMEINRFCVPFLSKKLPYENNGMLKDFMQTWKYSDLDLSQPFELSNPVFEDNALDYFNAISPGDTHPCPYQIHIAKTMNPTIDGIWFSTDNYTGISRRDTNGVYTYYYNYASIAGISLNRAESIDSNLNFIYFASDNIVRFDGSFFEVYTHSSAPITASTFRYDSDNDVAYVSSLDGFYVSQTGFSSVSPASATWTRYYDGNSILPAEGTGDFDFDSNYIWILPSFNIADNRIFKYDINAPGITSEVVSYNGTEHVNKNSIRIAPNGEIFVGGNWEITTARFSRREINGNWIVFDYNEPLVMSNPRQLRIDTNGKVFWGTSVGLLQYNYDGNFTKYDRFNGLTFLYNPTSSQIKGFDINISTANSLILNNIWVGGHGGLLRFKRYDLVSYSDYVLSKLLEPQNDPTDLSEAGINFVVPNNVHGGKIDPNRDLFLFQPHLFKVYWHMRPVVSAYTNTDIPSRTARTGGAISDPCLANMFDFPIMDDNQEFIIPWDKDMSKNWLFDGDTNVEFVISENNVDNNIVISENNDPEQIISEL